MVNCAGIAGPTSIKTEDIPTEQWDKVQQGTQLLLFIL